MIPEYISRKLREFTTAPTDRVSGYCYARLGRKGHEGDRLCEISDRYTFESHEEQEILAWAKAKVE